MRNPSPQSENYIDLLFDAIRRADVKLIVVYALNFKNKYAKLWDNGEYDQDNISYAFYAEYESAQPISLADFEECAKIIAFIYQVGTGQNSDITECVKILDNIMDFLKETFFYKEKISEQSLYDDLFDASDIFTESTDFNVSHDYEATVASFTELKKHANCKAEIEKFQKELDITADSDLFDAEICKAWLLPILTTKYQTSPSEIFVNYLLGHYSKTERELIAKYIELVPENLELKTIQKSFGITNTDEIDHYQKIRILEHKLGNSFETLLNKIFEKKIFDKQDKQLIISELIIPYLTNKYNTNIYGECLINLFFENKLSPAEKAIMSNHINHLKVLKMKNELDLSQDIVLSHYLKKEKAIETLELETKKAKEVLEKENQELEKVINDLDKKLAKYTTVLDASKHLNKLTSIFSKQQPAHKQLIKDKKAALGEMRGILSVVMPNQQAQQPLKQLNEIVSEKKQALHNFDSKFEERLPLLQTKNSVLEEQILKAIVVIATGVIPGLIGLAVHSKVTRGTYAFWRSRCHGIEEEVKSTLSQASSAV